MKALLKMQSDRFLPVPYRSLGFIKLYQGSIKAIKALLRLY
jgi:hypothetical protein